ncbi:sirohydrochlorin chelatase [Haloechinothrix sp. LS1_15]|uniref:sirohydrochlorin chelatase n=1 Tax=Haloechinothrix sp. LS1_15 TaxID=2652248 RepID=UPI002944F687|nr:sirohydrochlorin chelatase [Haloechinothrix sp. LS1_15]MDV6012073.1 sirohydrochlorin chelatase [Haloechinothrix sp. LS1_15]
MSVPPLVAVAHGSRDPRSAATVRELGRAVADRLQGTEVRVAFLDLSAPPVDEVLGELHAAGHREVVVVPLLLGSAYHARVDLPQLVAEATARLPMLRVSVAEVLGPDPALEDAAMDRLAQAGLPAGERDLGVVLTGVGSAQPAANDLVARLASRWHHRGDFAAVTHAFATTRPGVVAALARLDALGIGRVAIAPWFLAPGLLLDRVAEAAPHATTAAPIGAHPRVAELVVERYREAAGSPLGDLSISAASSAA